MREQLFKDVPTSTSSEPPHVRAEKLERQIIKLVSIKPKARNPRPLDLKIQKLMNELSDLNYQIYLNK